MGIVAWIWVVAAWVVGVGGVVLLVWAMVWDRSRGRRRCPKCWYDLAGVGDVPLVCPECGRGVRRARRLEKTRRRWRWGAVGLLMVLVGVGGWFGERVHRKGLLEATPTWVYVVGLPWLEDGALAVVQKRSRAGDIGRWEARLLAERLVGALDRDDGDDRSVTRLVLVMSLDAWALEPFGPRESPWGAWVRPTEIDEDAVERAFVRALCSDDHRVRSAARAGLAGVSSDTVGILMPLMLGGLDEERGSDREFGWRIVRRSMHRPGLFHVAWKGGVEWIAMEIRRVGFDHDAVRALLIKELSLGGEDAREVSVAALVAMCPEDERVRERVLGLLNDESVAVRRQVAGLLGRWRMDATCRAAMDVALRDDPRVAAAAFDVLAEQGAMSVAYRDEARLALEHSMHPELVMAAARVYVGTGGDRDWLVLRLFERGRGGERTYFLIEALLMERFAGVESDGWALGEATRMRVRDWAWSRMRDGEPSERVGSSVLFVLVGGDVEPGYRVARDAGGSAATFGALARSEHTVGVAVEIAALALDGARPDWSAFMLSKWTRGAGTVLLDRLHELEDHPHSSTASEAREAREYLERWAAWERRQGRR